MQNVTNRVTNQVTQHLKREDGSEARIVATAMYGIGSHMSVDVYVHRRANSDAQWELCSSTPHADWMKMSVDEYCERGRSPMLQTVTPGELLKVVKLVGQPTI